MKRYTAFHQFKETTFPYPFNVKLNDNETILDHVKSKYVLNTFQGINEAKDVCQWLFLECIYNPDLFKEFNSTLSITLSLFGVTMPFSNVTLPKLKLQDPQIFLEQHRDYVKSYYNNYKFHLAKNYSNETNLTLLKETYPDQDFSEQYLYYSKVESKKVKKGEVGVFNTKPFSCYPEQRGILFKNKFLITPTINQVTPSFKVEINEFKDYLELIKLSAPISLYIPLMPKIKTLFDSDLEKNTNLLTQFYNKYKVSNSLHLSTPTPQIPFPHLTNHSSYTSRKFSILSVNNSKTIHQNLFYIW